MPELLVNDYLQLAHRPDLQILTVRWLRTTSSPELRSGYQRLLDFAQENNSTRFWLVDSRRRQHLDNSDVHWLVRDYYPTLRPRLGNQVFLAFLVSPAQLADTTDDETLPPLPYTHGDYCSINQFTDEGEAVQWLTKHLHPAV
ncbi:hypothetical protein HMJ29_06795 [Hymenobacter taeanensis]|uniref:STAS/SEC14 domain-containing protein n=1 Tax=Hymenobacter taeanensis TaxID=2735321 RepID=A0A6M6BDS2_9BACT|nr:MULTISPECIES: hypothetical protein [Hymenobacter]QJX46661.1 hypothetical protein HMJ29_06795 [Hymenobacter taeanensis]UOQ80524.1 hypothetical protein MUN83_17130 [Hymenobacter sp. 5414T-23]